MEKQYITISLQEVVPYKSNPRQQGSAVEKCKASIEATGYIAPIILDEHYVILAGHTRHAALQLLGHEKAEVIVCTGLTDDQKKAYRILDNRVSDFSDWDIELLMSELEEIDLDLGTFHLGGIVGVDVDSLFEAGDGAPKKPIALHICPECGCEF